MRKALIFTALTVFMFTTSHSQEVRFGAKLGLNVSHLSGDTDGVIVGLKSGFHIGGLAEIILSEKFAIQPELLYSHEVYERGIEGGLFATSDIKSSYIRVPILAKYYFIEGLSAEIGPSFGILMASKVNGVDVKDNLKSFDAGLAIGASYRLNMGVFFGLRYNLGLMDINDVDGYNRNNQANTFQVSVGYFF